MGRGQRRGLFGFPFLMSTCFRWFTGLVFALSVCVSRADVSWQCPAEEGVAETALQEAGMLRSSQPWLLPRVFYRRDVHVEDGFVRTTIDQVYYNASIRRMEGTYKIPIPRGAAITRLAMTVKGVLRESAMVRQEKGKRVFETIRRERRDPVLLEWLDGEAFSMRVFPIEPKEHKRILISFTEPLLEDGDQWRYHVPAFLDEKTGRYEARVRVIGGAAMAWRASHNGFQGRVEREDLILETTQRQGAALSFLHGGVPEARCEWMTGADGHHYAQVRVRPALPRRIVGEQRHWIVLFEASADRDPFAARDQWEALQSVQQQLDLGDRLTVVVANTQARVIAQHAIDSLETVALRGGLDLGRAFDTMRHLAEASSRQAILVHLGGGKPSLGERKIAVLQERLPRNVPYLGMGCGHAPDMAFVDAMAAHTGGLSVRLTHGGDATRYLRKLDAFEVREVRLDATAFLSDQSNVHPEETWLAVARIDRESLPDRVTLRGRCRGRPWQQTWKANWGECQDAGYLPQRWARMEVARLLESEEEGYQEAIVALSKRAFVMSPFTSLIVLEDDAMHERFGIPLEAQDHWARFEAPLPNDLPSPRPEFRKAVEGPRAFGTNQAVEPPHVPKGGAKDILHIEIPEAMFSGTKVPIKLANLEPFSASRPKLSIHNSGPSLAIAWRPMFAGKPITLNERTTRRHHVRSFAMPKGTQLLSRGAPVTSSDPLPIIGEVDFVTDGDKDAADGSYVELGPGQQWIQIDLGEPRELWLIGIWHFHKSVRAYIDVIVQVSNDKDFVEGVETVFNNDHDNTSGMGIGKEMAWIEQNLGKMIHLKGEKARYVRCYSSGNTSNEMNHYIEVEVYGRTSGSPEQVNMDEEVRALERLESTVAEQWEAARGDLDLGWLRSTHAEMLVKMALLAGTSRAPSDLFERARTVADRWWAIDGASPRACALAAHVMRRMGRQHLEWAYLTTAVAAHGDRPEHWQWVIDYAEDRKDAALRQRALTEQQASKRLKS